VSLISYFILDLKLPIAVVSKMIAGHATIIMTLYYTKFGKAYMREVLAEAEKNELEAEQANHRRFLHGCHFRAGEPALCLCVGGRSAGGAQEDALRLPSSLTTRASAPMVRRCAMWAGRSSGSAFVGVYAPFPASRRSATACAAASS
jgi:hypothetical protein